MLPAETGKAMLRQARHETALAEVVAVTVVVRGEETWPHQQHQTTPGEAGKTVLQ